MAAALAFAASLTAFTIRAHAQLPADSLVRPAPVGDSLHHAAPARRFTPLRELGAMGGDSLATQRTLVLNSLDESFALAARDPHAFPLALNGPGQDHELLIDGIDTRGIGVFLAGRPVNDPATGRFSFAHIAPEFAEEWEILRGPRAAISGFNVTTAAINAVPRFTNTNHPLVTVRYEQSAYDYLASDLSFTQNLSRTTNASFAIDRQSTLGQYGNSALQYWNLRGAVRWFGDSTRNVLLTENFTHNHAGVNGGVLPEDLFANTAVTRVQLEHADAEDFRHDVTATALYRSASDTTLQTQVSIYYSSLVREFHAHDNTGFDPVAFPFAVTAQSNHTQWYGLDAHQSFTLSGLSFSGGVAAQAARTDSSANLPRNSATDFGAYGMAKQRVGESIALSASGRADRVDGVFRPTVGVEASLSPTNGLTLLASVLRTERVPTLQERSWTSPSLCGLNDPEYGVAAVPNEIHSVMSAGMRFDSKPVFCSIDASLRDVKHPVMPVLRDSVYVLTQADPLRIMSLASAVRLTVGHVSAEGSALCTIEQRNGVQLSRRPVVYARGGIYYSHPRFMGVPLELRAGIEGTLLTSFTGETYLPGDQMFVPAALASSNANGSTDIVVMAHLGDAYVRLGMQNLFDRHVYFTPYYPITGRAFHLGVTWALFD